MKTVLCGQFLLLLLLSSGVFSEEVTNALPQTGGNRAFAMGGTYIASNQGINALFGNPAGLAISNTSEVIIGYYWQIHKTMQFDDQYYLRWNMVRGCILG